jgi:hypothetical protein
MERGGTKIATEKTKKPFTFEAIQEQEKLYNEINEKIFQKKLNLLKIETEQYLLRAKIIRTENEVKTKQEGVGKGKLREAKTTVLTLEAKRLEIKASINILEIEKNTKCRAFIQNSIYLNLVS